MTARAIEAGKGASRPPTKRGGWGVTPVYYKNRIYSMGTTGRVYAYDAADGRRVWESATSSSASLQSALKTALETKVFLSDVTKPYWVNDNLSSMVAAGGVIIAPFDWGRLAGFNEVPIYHPIVGGFAFFRTGEFSIVLTTSGPQRTRSPHVVSSWKRPARIGNQHHTQPSSPVCG